MLSDNIPDAIRDAPLPLMGPTEQQLSFGERAALEGVLAQLRPALAVEIGSAAGGSLQRIARHSRRVHSFDLRPPAADVAELPNVWVHLGDSRFTLPRWLATGPPVDFALVDGDHSADGVYADLTVLLGACSRAVILVHDTANSSVRAGVEGALLHRTDIDYFDLDFLSGYTFARGAFAGERWGGLALVVTGESGTAQTQDLYRHS